MSLLLRSRLKSSRAVAAASRRPDRLVRRGVIGVVLAFAVLGTLQAISVPVFQPPDEASHWGYARLVSDGELPTIYTLIPVEGVDHAERAVAWRSTRKYRSVWVANHPPLYYAVMAVPVRVGIEIGHPVGAVQVARVLSVLIAAGGIALVAGIVRELVPGRPALAVAAAGLTAAMPTFIKTASNLYNDSLAFTTAMAALLLAVRIVMRGPTGVRVALLAVFASAAALTRASGLVVAGVAGLVVVVRAFLPSVPGALPRSVASRFAEAFRHGAVVGVAVAASAGWFYLRNRTLYGDLTGSEALLEMFNRDYRRPVPEILIWWEYWRAQVRNLMDYTFYMINADHMPNGGSPSGWLWLVSALPILGGVVIGLRRLRRRLAGSLELPPERPGTRAHRVAAFLLLALLFALVEVSLAQFFRDGGSVHARYLFPTMPLVALGAAIGLAALPGGRRGLPTALLLAGFTWVNLWLWNQYLWIVIPGQPPLHTIEVALAAAEAPDPVTLLGTAGALLVIAVALQASALWSLGAPPVPAAPPPLTFHLEKAKDAQPEHALSKGFVDALASVDAPAEGAAKETETPEADAGPADAGLDTAELRPEKAGVGPVETNGHAEPATGWFGEPKRRPDEDAPDQIKG